MAAAAMARIPSVPVLYSLETDAGRCAIVAGLIANNADAISFFYDGLLKGLRFYFVRKLGADDSMSFVHDTLLMAIGQIQKGGLEKPEALLGFVRTIAFRRMCEGIRERIHARNVLTSIDTPAAQRAIAGDANVERDAQHMEVKELVQSTLKKLSTRDQEVLRRYYLLEQTKEQICKDMNLNETQFRLLKSRAKTRFGAAGKKLSGLRTWELRSAKPTVRTAASPGRWPGLTRIAAGAVFSSQRTAPVPF